jgi:hypothetical protein
MTITGDNQAEPETGASSVNEENNDEPKKETYDERQIRLKTEARAFALSGYSTKKQRTTKRSLPVKRAATKAAYSSESSNSSISDFSDDDNDNYNYNNNGGSNKKCKVTQEPTGGGIYTPQVVPQMSMMYPQMHMPPPQPTQYMTVRVQVPYEELLPGRKMVVDLPNRLPLEVVIPLHILPGTIIPVQVPLLGEGMTMNNPYYSQQNNPPPQQQQGQQQQQQQQQKEQIGKEEILNTTFWDQNWYNMFNRLVAYKKEHNTTNVSRRQHRKDARLGRWVYQQREEKKRKTNKKMTEDKIQLLNSLDFDWGITTRPPNTPWNEMYEQLAEYYRKNQSTKLTKKNGYQTKLFQWINGQRERYRKNSLPKEQIKLLNDINFDFEYSLNNTWMKNYNLLVKYKEEHGGSTRVPKAYPELGNWVGNQRRRKMRLKKERIDLLEKIDFEWGPNTT